MTMSFRMTAVMATFAGFPMLMRWVYFALMFGLKQAATKAGMWSDWRTVALRAGMRACHSIGLICCVIGSRCALAWRLSKGSAKFFSRFLRVVLPLTSGNQQQAQRNFNY